MSSTPPQNWFADWFGAHYAALYTHRDPEQAQRQISVFRSQLKEILQKEPQLPWLDIGCGAGRHLEVLKQIHSKCVGLDYSAYLLGEAQERCGPESRLVRGDMRDLPFPEGSFAFASSFFSSFGYFASPQEDLSVLQEMHRILSPQGLLFLDLMDPQTLRSQLPRNDAVECSLGTVYQERFWQEGCVIKKISWTDPNPAAHEAKEHIAWEKVRVWETEILKTHLTQIGFEVLDQWGSEIGDPVQPGITPRVAWFLRKKA